MDSGFFSDNSFTSYGVGDFYILYLGNSAFGTLIITTPRFAKSYWQARVWQSVPKDAYLLQSQNYVAQNYIFPLGANTSATGTPRAEFRPSGNTGARELSIATYKSGATSATLNKIVDKDGNWVLGGGSGNSTANYNTTYVQSGSINYYWTWLSNTRRMVTVQFDVTLKGSYASENVCQIAAAGSVPSPVVGGSIYVCYGTNTYAPAKINMDGGRIQPWYCGTVSGQWYGAITYLAS